MTTWRFLKEAAGLDPVWLAVDDEGHVGAFMTAGSALLPEFVVDVNMFDGALEVIEGLPVLGDARPMREDDGDGCYASWEELAERGLYTYDTEWDDSGSPAQQVLRAMFFPSRALHLQDLPEDVRDVLDACRLSGVVFASTPVLCVDEPPR
ncbi:hypothetical protein [Deinococcus pimensis]|uniref:hypothetical protein n=1 Tax=Deinococcus pimensis TaxID=309888 RepID=UPI0004B102ED|nr:hypothetical protein [Deinococcus pimensis]